MAQLDVYRPTNQKGHGIHFLPEHKPGLQVQSPVECMQEATPINVSLSH